MLLMIKCDLFVEPIKPNCCSVSFGVLIDYTTRRANEKSGIQVIGVNFNEILIKGKEI